MRQVARMVVYIIRNKLNGKIYIGKTFGMMRSRWSQHIYRAKNGENWLISRAIRKYGAENFSIMPLVENVETCSKLHELERKFISKFNANNRKHGYNLTAGGEGSKLKRSRISIIKQSRSMKKIYKNKPELRELRSEQMSKRIGPLNPMFGRKGSLAPNFGRIITSQQRKKIFASWTDERRRQQSLKMQGNSCRKARTL